MKNNDISALVGQEPLVIRPVTIFHPLVCDFLNELSQKLMHYKEYPDIISFAFFCRKSNISKLSQEIESRHRIGRGLVFHITPSNVPVNFAFSYLFGLLSGNANIVRVPSKEFVQTDIICRTISEVLSKEKYNSIREQTLFVQYPRNNEITAYYSKICDARIIWGGDLSVRNIRNIPINERTVEIAFADRKSLSVINADAVMDLQQAELIRLAENFYNDTYLMDQNACSSPRFIVWIGKDIINAQCLFWEAVLNVAQKYDLTPIKTIDKYTDVLLTAMLNDESISVTMDTNLIYLINLKKPPVSLDDIRGNFGVFYQIDCSDLCELVPFIDKKHQTLTYFGLDKKILLDFIFENHLQGIDRIVPIGKSLDIGLVWDGYDIIGTLSRLIEVV